MRRLYRKKGMLGIRHQRRDPTWHLGRQDAVREGPGLEARSEEGAPEAHHQATRSRNLNRRNRQKSRHQSDPGLQDLH